MKRSEELEREASAHIAALMAAAARTSPKSRGIDNIEVFCIDDTSGKDELLAKMREISKKENKPSFDRDANSMASACQILAIGVRSNPAGLNCGFCGYPNCAELSKSKSACSFNIIDLGIAVSSAAAVAGQLHIDNRLMYSIGRASLDLKLFSASVTHALGIPLSVTGKNPFFDRK